MISADKATAFIKSKEISTPDLNILNSFSESYKILGQIIVSDKKLFKTDDFYVDNKVTLFSKTFGDDFGFNPFDCEEGLKLALFIFGETNGKAMSKIWELFDTQPYQTDYSRRSFRTASNKDHLEKKLDFLQNLYKLYHYKESGYLALNIFEIVQYSTYNNSYYGDFSNLIAVELNKGNEKLKALINDIFCGEDEIGGVSREIIKGCLLSDDPTCWKMVGNLLLAAQREEGLRQTILETLDETSVGALKYIVKLILDNDLFRFSAVVRAIGTWFGFGWEAPKKATIKRILTLSHSFFEHPELIENAVKSKDNLEIYVALWVNALIDDVDNSNLIAIDIIKNRSREKQILACMFIYETKRTRTSLLPWIYDNLGNDPVLDYFMLLAAPAFEMTEDVFETIRSIASKIPKDGKIVQGEIFDWTYHKITSNFFYELMINYGNDKSLQQLGQEIKLIPSEIREKYIRKIFPKHDIWSAYNMRSDNLIPLELSPSSWKRSLMHQAITDRNESVMATGLNVLRSIKLEQPEYTLMCDLLKRKSKTLRTIIITQISTLPNEILQNNVANLTTSKNADQRLGGLEVLCILNEEEKLSDFVISQVAQFKERPKFSKNEGVYLDKLNKKVAEYSFQNGFGVIDYNRLKPIFEPKSIFTHSPKKAHLFSDFIDIAKTTKAVNTLIAIFEENEQYEYSYEGQNWEDNQVTVLLSNTLQHKVKYDDKFSKLEWFNHFPLADKWENWYKESKLNDFELILAIDSLESNGDYYKNDAYKEFILKNRPKLGKLNIVSSDKYDRKENKISNILDQILLTFSDLNMVISFILDVMEHVTATYPKDLKAIIFEKNDWNNTQTEWTDTLQNAVFGRSLIYRIINETRENIDIQERYWQCQMFLYYAKLSNNKIGNVQELAKLNPESAKDSAPGIALTALLFHKDILNDDDLLYHSLLNDDIFGAFEGLRKQFTKSCFPEKFPHTTFAQLRKNILEIELERGDLATEVTSYVSKVSKVEGASYLLRTLGFLGKETLSRGYSYWGTLDRKEIFSKIIKISVPKEEDSVSQFVKDAKALKLPKKRWLEVAMYAPQWSNWIGALLKLDKLEDAVWWFHAHGSDYMDANKETIISRYSNIDAQDFTGGALDLDWFNLVYPSIKKTNWSMLNDSSKYISDGNGHRLIKLYTSVILGEIKIKQVLEKIKTKRDKDYVKALGLVSLSKTIPEKDLLKRYNLLQTFLKESKQFGSQRQESEKHAVKIALDNLSRTAGYRDSIRFSLAMEAKSTQTIMDKSIVNFEDTTIKLVVTNEGKAEIVVEKNGKTQKSIPTKYRKEKAIIVLKEGKTYLRKQYARTKKFLEDAMTREEVFSISDIENIMHHPVVNALLSKLVLFFKTENQLGFWAKNGLVDINNKAINLSEGSTCVIAHASHLYETITWDLFQKYAFDTKLVQPFKQIFRELYVITKDEKEKGKLSERYQGHQIQPKKTVALLRTKGWTVNHEEGLQKVFHQKGYIATLYAMADWFSPSDVEAPTLEYISFESRKDYKNIPLEQIDPVTFSEVMRDVDLVVSVAHVGGVDPEASHSTLEMRAVLAKESARLFKLENVEVKERHIIITGKLGIYSIHLGSGIVSKSGLRLSIIPVHSQHRGRVFLPFVDDDPKSAEIISKMKLLSEDNKIKDPTILAQINS